MYFVIIIHPDTLNMISILNGGLVPAPECLLKTHFFMHPVDPDGHNKIVTAEELASEFTSKRTDTFFLAENL